MRVQSYNHPEQTITMRISDVEADQDAHTITFHTLTGPYLVMSDDEFERAYLAYVGEDGKDDDETETLDNEGVDNG